LSIIGGASAPESVGSYTAYEGSMFFIGDSATANDRYWRWTAGTLTELVAPDRETSFMEVIGDDLYIVATDGVNAGMWRYAPQPTLAATGVDATGYLAMGGLLILAGSLALVASTRRRAA
jgi:LPXTG-motif cell wall-anchored protein